MNKKMNKERILSVKDLLKVQALDNGEEMVAVQDETDKILCTYEKFDMQKYTADKMYVRIRVLEKLMDAAKELEALSKNKKFNLVYSYRHPKVQKTYFKKRKEELRKKMPDLDKVKVEDLAHQLSANPKVAGHPTGGAIDITVVENGEQLDMGTKIADFSDTEKIKTFYPELTKEQQVNRMLLRELLMKQGFAPFDGEWWHFSYGDAEWAAYYGKNESLYAPVIIENNQ